MQKLIDDLMELHCYECEGSRYGCTGCEMREEVTKLVKQHSPHSKIDSAEVSERHAKPPLGIEPKEIWEEKRCIDLKEAIDRRVNTEFEIPKEWVDEYYELAVKINKRKRAENNRIIQHVESENREEEE